MPRSKRRPSMYSIDGELASERGALMALDPDAIYGQAYPNKKRMVSPSRGRSLVRNGSGNRSRSVPAISSSRSPRGRRSSVSLYNSMDIDPIISAGEYAVGVPQGTVAALSKVAAGAQKMMKSGQEYLRRNPSPPTSVRGRVYGHRKWLSASTGFYKGKFKKARRTKNPKVETKCLKKGFHVTNELHGKIEDNHCVYVGHSTWNAKLIATAIAGAFLRKLFKKAGLQMDQGDQELIGNEAYNAEGWVLEYVTFNPINGQTVAEATYTTVDNDTFHGVLNLPAKFGGFLAHIEAHLLRADGSAVTTNVEPYMLNVYTYDQGIGTNDKKRLAANLNLSNEFITVYSSSTLKIQNRTAGDNATTTDKYELDRIDNQPLKGYRYQFYGEPRLKYARTTAPTTGGVNQINYNSTDGTLIWRATDLPQPYIEPPVPKFWANCPKSSGVVLQPGEMKKGYIAVKYSGRFVNVVKKIRAERTVIDRVIGIKGKTELFAFEEKIRTSGSNPITLMYETEMKVGCTTKSGPTAPLQTYYTSAVKDVPPP